MSAEIVFTIANASVLPFWLLLLVVPHAKVTHWLVHSGVVPVLLGSLYVAYLIMSLMSEAPGGMGSLEELMVAFTNPIMVVAAWVHYLVFDLFVGAWMVRDARRHNIPHLSIVVPLVLTLMAGPFGLLLYIALKGIWKRRFSLDEVSA